MPLSDNDWTRTIGSGQLCRQFIIFLCVREREIGSDRYKPKQTPRDSEVHEVELDVEGVRVSGSIYRDNEGEMISTTD